MVVNPEITHADLFRMLGQAVAEAEAWKQHALRLAQELAAVRPVHEPVTVTVNGRRQKEVQ